MDVNTNGLSTGGGYHRGGAYFGGAAAASGEDATDQYYAPKARSLHHGDSLAGIALARRTDAKKKTDKMDPEQAIKIAKTTRMVSWCLGAIAFIIFAIMFLQPILLPIFTLGAVFSGGYGEWLEFTYTILKASLFPAAIGIIFGWLGYFANRRVKDLSAALEEASEKAAASLMDRLSPQERYKFPT